MMHSILYSSIKEKFDADYILFEQYYKPPSQIFDQNFTLPSHIKLLQTKNKGRYNDFLLTNIPNIPPEIIWRLEQSHIHSSLDFLHNLNIKNIWEKLGIRQPTYTEIYSLISSYSSTKEYLHEYKFQEFVCIVNCTYQGKTTTSIYLSPILLTLTCDVSKNQTLASILLQILQELEVKHIFLIEIHCSLISSFVTNQIDILQDGLQSLKQIEKLAKKHNYFLKLSHKDSKQISSEVVITLFYILCCSSELVV